MSAATRYRESIRPRLAHGPDTVGGNGCDDDAGNSIGSSGKTRVGPGRIHLPADHPDHQLDHRAGAAERLGLDGHPLGGPTMEASVSGRQRGQVTAIVRPGPDRPRPRRRDRRRRRICVRSEPVDPERRRLSLPWPGHGSWARSFGQPTGRRDRRQRGSRDRVGARRARRPARQRQIHRKEGLALGNVMGATSIPNDAHGVVVEARTNWRPFLLGVIGVVDWQASSTATAKTPGKSVGGGVMPVGIDDDALRWPSAMSHRGRGRLLRDDNLTPGEHIGPGQLRLALVRGQRTRPEMRLDEQPRDDRAPG